MSKLLMFVALGLLCVPAFCDELPANLPGTLIDELMKKNAGEVTAESALPSKPSKKAAASDQIAAPSNPEASQPVFNNPATIGNSSKENPRGVWGRLMMSLALIALIAGGVFITYRRWPGAKKLTQRARMIEVLSQHYLGPKRSLAVIRVAGEACLIGLTDSNITLLKTLSLLDDDVPSETREAQVALRKTEVKKFDKTLGVIVQEQVNPREDEFSMQGLKEIIGDRLKNMREI